jgi:hypothetical protein
MSFFSQHRLALFLTPAALATLAACTSEIIGGGAGADASTGVSTGGAPAYSSSRATGYGADTTTAASSTAEASSSSTSVTVSSSSSGASTTTSSSSSGGSSGTACADAAPEPLASGPCTSVNTACHASTSVCQAVADAHAAPSFGLRMAHLTMTAPAALTTGVVQSVFSGGVMPRAQECFLNGSATFNWLLGFDTVAGTLVTGAAKPVTDPTLGYTFVNGPVVVNGVSFAVAPVTLTAPVDATCGVTSSTGDVILPFYNDTAGSLVATLFPLRGLHFINTQVTPDHNCIGAYDTAGLQASNSCQPDATHPGFIDGGRFEAYIVLETADTVLVSPLQETLCALLTNNAAMYGATNGSGLLTCKRDGSNAIVFQGDWCSTTNAPATATCADAMRFAGSFAASGVAIDG